MAGPAPYALAWTRLPSGKWAGLHGDRSFLFQPGVRARGQDEVSVGATGSTDGSTQALDEAGTLWIAAPNRDGELVLRQRDRDGNAGPETHSKVQVTACDILLMDR